MKQHTPFTLILSTALLISIISLISIVVLIEFTTTAWYHYLAALCVLFFASFLTLHYVVSVFLYKRIRLIYKSIDVLKQKKGKPYKKLDINRDILGIAEEEVTKWVAKSEAELESMKKQEAYRREFIGNVFHELKTPVFNIQGYILTLLEGGLEDEKVNHKFLVKAEKSVKRLVNIIDDLNTIAVLESDTQKLKMEEIDILRLIREVFEIQEYAAKQKNIKLLLKTENPNQQFLVKADRKKIKQVFINLIDNSCKYGRENGTTIVKVYDMDDKILFEVSDNGLGISQVCLPRIFERFYRVDESRSREQGGTGLGLSIVKHIIEAHGETIHVKSKEGKGSTFTFTLKRV